MYLMLRPDQDTFAEAGTGAEWDETGEFRHLDSNQDKQSQSLLGCQLPHAGQRRLEHRRSDASTIPSHPQTLVRLWPQIERLPAGTGSYGGVRSASASAMAARAQPSIRQ